MKRSLTFQHGCCVLAVDVLDSHNRVRHGVLTLIESGGKFTPALTIGDRYYGEPERWRTRPQNHLTPDEVDALANGAVYLLDCGPYGPLAIHLYRAVTR